MRSRLNVGCALPFIFGFRIFGFRILNPRFPIKSRNKAHFRIVWYCHLLALIPNPESEILPKSLTSVKYIDNMSCQEGVQQWVSSRLLLNLPYFIA
jgi:hypothetical protein